MSKLSSRPPQGKQSKVENFIAGAERRRDELRAQSSGLPMPWDDPKVRDDVLKVYNLRLPEPYLFKLKYIAEQTPDSMHKFCLDILLPAIDAKIEALTHKG